VSFRIPAADRVGEEGRGFGAAKGATNQSEMRIIDEKLSARCAALA
jgi:hypothetical protein